jgi:hypothetical protein
MLRDVPKFLFSGLHQKHARLRCKPSFCSPLSKAEALAPWIDYSFAGKGLRRRQQAGSLTHRIRGECAPSRSVESWSAPQLAPVRGFPFHLGWPASSERPMTATHNF